jgi:hypothetical protein
MALRRVCLVQEVMGEFQQAQGWSRGGENGFSDHMTWKGSKLVFSDDADGKRSDFSTCSWKKE